VKAGNWLPGRASLEGTGNLYISDPVNHRIRIVTILDQNASVIRRVDTAGGISHQPRNGLPGDGRPAVAAELNTGFCAIVDTDYRRFR
jgi:hypothetical protein